MMRRQTILALFVFGILSLPVAAVADITIAVVGGMAGPFAKMGEEFKQGTRGAVRDINGNGGLLGQRVTFVVRDDNCNADEAKKIALELVEIKVAMVMGHLCSDASIAASGIYEENGIIEISPSSTNPAYTERGLKNVFRTTGRDDMQGFVIAEHILRNFRTKRLAIIVDDNGYSRGVANVAKKFLNQGGMNEVLFETAPAEPFDFTKLLQSLTTNKVDLVLYPGLPGPMISLATLAREKGAKFRVVGADAFSGIKFDKSNRRAFDGYQFSFPPDPKDDKRNREIVKKFKTGGYDAQAFTFYSYAAIQVWAQAVQKANTLKAAEVARALRAGKFSTVLGDIGFDEKGDITNPGFVMYFFNKGKRYYLE